MGSLWRGGPKGAMYGSIYLVPVHFLAHPIPKRAEIFCGDLLTKRAVKTARKRDFNLYMHPAGSSLSLPSLFNCVDRDYVHKENGEGEEF